jgi:hypothetical protein
MREVLGLQQSSRTNRAPRMPSALIPVNHNVTCLAGWSLCGLTKYEEEGADVT